jgi:hypothetical protein
MGKVKPAFSLFLIVISLLSLSCSSIVYKTAFPTLHDGTYDSEFPYKSCSKELEEISSSIHMINSMAFYRSYIFAENSGLKKQDITKAVINNRAVRMVQYENTSSGTATILYSSLGTVALLTCAHVIDCPDTVYSYFLDEAGKKTDLVQSVSIKGGHSIYISGFPEGSEVEPLLINRALDIAVVGRKYPVEYANQFVPFSYPAGEAKKLEWGSFVYIFGFPMTFKMISKAIVSSPNRDKQGSFLVDAVFNRGFSGGIVLAIRDGVPNFEFVGIVTSVPAEYEYYLKPADEGGMEYNPKIPYSDNIYVEKRMDIKYGIAKITSVETIISFLKSNEENLKRMGYDLSGFYEKRAVEEELPEQIQ